MIKRFYPLFLAFFLILPVILIGCVKKPNQSNPIFKINNKILKVEVVQTRPDLLKGLSGRKDLCEDCGMLFNFPDYQTREFWMKDMNFPLDIIWLNDGEIVKISASVPILTDNQITTVNSDTPVNRVLEVNSGWAQKNGVKAGDHADFN